MTTLTLAQANTIITTALSEARKAGYKAMAVVVLDDAGHLKAAQREDGASMFRVDVATGKGWACVGFGVSSRTLMERAKDNPNFYASLSATSQGRFIPQSGAVVIKDAGGNVIGAASASGGTGDEDELICIAGIQAAGLKHA